MTRLELENLLKPIEFISSQEIFNIYQGFITPPKTKLTERLKQHTQAVYQSYCSTFGMDLRDNDLALTGQNALTILNSTYPDIKQKSPLEAHQWYVLQESLRWLVGRDYSLKTQPRRSDPKLDIIDDFRLPDGAITLSTLTSRIQKQLNYSNQITNRVKATTTFNNLLVLLLRTIGGDFYTISMANNDVSRYKELNQALTNLPPSTPESRQVYNELKSLFIDNQLFLTKEGVSFFKSLESNYLLKKIPGFGIKQLEWIQSALT